MITNEGKNVIRKVFAGQLQRVANTMVIGSGSFDAAATLTDTSLTRESYRTNITSISADLANSRIVFKAIVPAGTVSKMGEVGLIQGDSIAFSYIDLPIGSLWSEGSYSATHARNVGNSVSFSAAASATFSPSISGINVDLSGYADNASVLVSYLVTTTNLQTFKLRFLTSTGNYFEYTITPIAGANNYAVARLPKSSATQTGSPTWASITQIQVVGTVKSAGSVELFLDGIRFEYPANTSSVLVARNVLTTPATLDKFIDTEVEYSLAVSI